MWGGTRSGRVAGTSSVCAAERDTALFVILVVANFCGVKGEEGFFPCHPSALCLLELFPSLTLGWEGEGGAEIVCGDGVQVSAFNEAVGACSLILSLFHPKDLIRNAGSFIPPRCHIEEDVDSVYVVDIVTVGGQVVEEISCGDLVVVGERFL